MASRIIVFAGFYTCFCGLNQGAKIEINVQDFGRTWDIILKKGQIFFVIAEEMLLYLQP